MRIHSIFFFFIIFSKSFFCNGQQKDFGTWSYFNTQVKWNEKISFCSSEHFLRYENASEWWMFLHDLSVTQKLNNHWSHELHVRLVEHRKTNNTFEDRSLFYYCLNGNWTKNKFSLGVRSRWQTMAYGNHWDDAYKGPFYYHRLKIVLGYQINYHLKVSFSDELFQPLNRPERKGIDQYRIAPMISYRRNKHYSFDFFYQIQHQTARINPYTYFILGTGVNFTF